jgi:hypothetical protein
MRWHLTAGWQSAVLGWLISATGTYSVTGTVDVVGSNVFDLRPGVSSGAL